jgi:FkbM family methyltransferase
VTISHPDGGLRLQLTADPVDAVVVESVFHRHRHQYFPDDVDAGTVRLVLDIGAHHGAYAVGAAWTYPMSNVIAVEPSAASAAIVRQQIGLNDLEHRCAVVQCAIGGEQGTTLLRHDPSGSWGHSTVEAFDGEVETVVVDTLAGVLRRAGHGGRTPNVVKCNAEGAEFGLVAQLASLPHQPQLVVLMLHADLGDVDGARRALGELGYRVEELTDDRHPVWHCWYDN